MSGNDVECLPIERLAPRIRNRELSVSELLERVLSRIEAHESKVEAFSHVSEHARDTARRLDDEIRQGRYRGPLHGIPIGIKDNYLTEDMPTTVGTKVPDISFPRTDATTVRRLREAGAVLIGKTNMHEFAWGNVTPPTKNPWDFNRVPGGSSGGSGAAVAASLCTAALGSDTGGSVRIPASLCGTVGVKPTYGSVSKNGIVTHSWSLDHPGPLTKSVTDAALLLNILAAYDPNDPSSREVAVPDYGRSIGESIGDLRIGVCRNHFFGENDAEVEAAVETAIEELAGLASGLVEFEIPNLQYGLGAIFTIELASSSCYHDRSVKAGLQRGFQPDVRNLVEAGKFITATDYLKAEQFRRLLMRDFAEVFDSVDLIVGPTTPITAWELDQTSVRIGDSDESVLAVSWRLTYPFNLVGLPAVSLPCGFDSRNLPIGLQIAGKPLSEEVLLRVAYAYESRHDWSDRTPNL